MIITLSGLPGAGKSTIKNLLAERLNLKKYSMGDLRGKMAQDRGLTIDEFNKLGLTEAFTDKDADQFQEKLGKTDDNFVIDGLLSWYFIPQSIKVFIDVDPGVGAERIFADRAKNPDRNDEPEYATVDETKATIAGRVASNSARYQKWYGVDYLDKTHYDLVIDTSHDTPNGAVEKILTFISHSATLPPV